MNEWKVLLNGKLYSNRFDEEWMAQCHVEEEVLRGVAEESQFEVLQMTDEEMEEYI